MGHDPERVAAVYLGGGLRRMQRERLERHLLDCEDCWAEVQAGRRGRALAESVREVAPQHLRERVRATIDATPARPRRWRARQPAVLAAALVLAAVVAGGLLLVTREQQPQPPPIAAAVAAYRTGGPTWSETATAPPAWRLGDLVWRGSGRGMVGGLPVVAHTYRDAAGHRVVLLRAEDRSFPEAVGARHAAAGETWVAEVGGVVLFCADRPWPSLVVGQDEAEVLLAADQLGLR